MKKVCKRIVAIVCVLCLLGGVTLYGEIKLPSVQAETITAKQTKVEPYDNATPRTAPVDIPEGYVFAGWYQQADCAEPLETAGSGYAKFVDENIFRVKAQITADATAEKDSVDIRMVTSVDSIYYSSVGFEITINGKPLVKTSNKVYEKLYAVGEKTGDIITATPQDIFCSASLYFKAYTIEDIPNISFDTVISVRARWVTQDGTVVCGQPSNKTIDMGVFGKESVDYGTILNCDSKDYLVQDAGKVNVVADDFKEGAAALSVSCDASDILFEFNRGKRIVDISDCSDGYLHFWIHINDTSYLNYGEVYAELSSGGKSDVEELQWTLTGLKNGWNEVKLAFSSASITGNIDYEAIDYFKLSLSKTCSNDLVVRLDDVRAVGSSKITDCDSKSYFNTSSGTVSVVANEYKEGSGALKCTGSNLVWYQFVRTTSPVDMQQYADGRLEFWLYIKDVTALSTNRINIELGSATKEDAQELEWHLYPSELTNGWNKISLPIAAPDSVSGTINLTAVQHFRIWHQGGTENLMTIIDDVRVVEKEAQIVDTDYQTKDIVIADVIPTEMGYEVYPNEDKDSTEGIQAALNDCYTAGGGTVYLPAGTYKISDSINIPAYVTLRGDWRDPDSEGNGYGTEIHVNMDAVDGADEAAVTAANTSGVFELHGSSGVVGLTVYYPNQTLSDVKIYPYTVYIVGEMLPTVRNMTIINGYRGIGATIGENSHESLQVDNFKGTFLDTGMQLYYSADVGTGKNISISNKYWTQYDSSISESALTTYTKEHTVGIKLGDIEWSEFTNVSIEDCKIGIQTVEGRRSDKNIWFAGSFYDLQINDCGTGLQADFLDTRWGMNIAKSSFLNCTSGVVNKTKGFVQLCDVEFKNVTTQIQESYAGTVPIDNADLSEKQIDYTMSYVKPDSRMLVANLSDETVVNKENLALKVTLNITDALYQTLQTNKGMLYFELSQAEADKNEYQWGIDVGTLKSGKQEIVLKIADAKPQKGTPDLTRTVNWFRIFYFYNGTTGDLTNGVTVNKAKVVDLSGEIKDEWYIINKDTEVTKKTYEKSNCDLRLTQKDASAKLQNYLNWMYKTGGGVVYVPSGIYSFYHPITVPEGVELRGASSVATREQRTECAGSLFLCYYGDEGKGDGTAFITLAGENAGLNGVRILYANNGVVTNDTTNKTLITTYAVKGRTKGVYVVNSMIAASAYGVDFRGCDNHYIEGVSTCCYYNTYVLGGTEGTITGCLQNPTVYERTAAPLNFKSWNDQNKLQYSILRREAHYITLEDAKKEVVYNNFAFGVMTMLTNIEASDTQVVNIGTDKVGASSAQLVMDGGSLFGVNILRSNTTTTELKSEDNLNKQYIKDCDLIESQSYKYIEGDLELHNRLNIYLQQGDVANEPAITKENVRTVSILNGDHLDFNYADSLNLQQSTDDKKEGTGAIRLTGKSKTRFVANLHQSVNALANKSGKLHLWFYVNKADYLATSNETKYPLLITIASDSSCNNALTWNYPLANLNDGWNELFLDLNTPTSSSGSIDFSAIKYVVIQQDMSMGGYQNSSLVTAVDDISILAPTASDEIAEQKTIFGYNGTEVKGSAVVRELLYLDAPINIKAYGKGAIHLQFYINNKSNLGENGALSVEIGSSRRSDCEELQWVIPVTALQDGWNDITLRIADANEKGKIHLGAIDYFRVYTGTGNSDELVTALKNVYVTIGDKLGSVTNGGNTGSDWNEWFE